MSVVDQLNKSIQAAKNATEMAIVLYEDQVKTSAELGVRVAKAEEALKVAAELLERWTQARRGIPQPHLNLLFDESAQAINKINSILGGE